MHFSTQEQYVISLLKIQLNFKHRALIAERIVTAPYIPRQRLRKTFCNYDCEKDRKGN